ncbi:hypothetical protein FRC08_014779 [Ceratobasidium sp. 394]|nr:hypothetical protein FRC08_014779 [Ceratobasidium sp. 394]
MSLEDAELQFRSLQKARIFQSRLKKVVGCIRDLLTLAAPATAFIPYVGPLVGAVCGIGAGLAAIAHERIELEQAFQFSNLRAAVQQTLDTRNTLDDIMTCQTVLNNTTYQALLLMADYDDVQKMLAPERYTLIDHEDHMRY